MIHDLIVGKFIAVIKGEETPEEHIQESKEKINKWYQNKIGDWVKIISVEENKDDILQSIIKIETWDTPQFSPVHSEAYSNMMIEIAKLKINSNKIISK